MFKIARVIFIFIALLGLSFSSLCDFKLPSNKGFIKTEKYKDGEVINILDLVKIYGGTYGKDDISKYPFWEINKHRIVFSKNSAVVSVDSKIINLKIVPIEKDGSLYVGTEFVYLVFPKIGFIIEDEKSYEPTRQSDKSSGEEETQKEITVNVLVSYDLIRITFEGTMVSFANITKQNDRIEVRFPRSKVEQKEIDLGEGIAIKLFSGDQGKEVHIILDKNFKEYETVNLKNPERLVLLIKGTGQKTSQLSKVLDKAKSKEVFFAQETVFQKKKNSILVVLDPGHGAQDTGTITKDGTTEKELTLFYSKEIKDALEKEGIDVLLTRNGDDFIPLRERTALANFNCADLFISIHFNSSPIKSVKGSESYIMSKEATDLWSKEVAEKENLTLSKAEEGEDLSLILWNLAQNQFVVESASIAGELQEKLNQLFNTKDRGVRQAPFAVLEGAQMPAVLLEIAFLSNPEEAKQVKDEKFVENVVSSIKEVLLKFKERNVPPASN